MRNNPTNQYPQNGFIVSLAAKQRAKKVRTTSDDAGGKSVSEKSKSTGGKCVKENYTSGKSGATPTSNNPFEASRSKNPQYFVDVVKDTRTKNNNLEFLIG
jgi:hypothetical protein